MSMNCQVITSVSKYTKANLEMFVNSLKFSGFSGKKIAVIFTCDTKTLDYLDSEGFFLDFYGCKPVKWGVVYEGESVNLLKENVFSDRFYKYWKLLSVSKPSSYSVITDCRDVIFQKNPELWLNQNLSCSHHSIVASCENMLYEDEEWNKENMRLNFPEFSEAMEDKFILNAGVIAGKNNSLLDLCNSIYLAALAGRKQTCPKLTSTDQSAYNIIMQTSIWKERTLFSDIQGDWAAQMGTIAAYPGKIKASPSLLRDGLINANGEEYTIVHQYDRIKSIKDVFERKFLS